MVRRNEFQEIIASLFAIFIFLMVGSLMIKDFPEITSLSILINIIFFGGIIIIVVALIKKLKDLF